MTFLAFEETEGGLFQSKCCSSSGLQAGAPRGLCTEANPPALLKGPGKLRGFDKLQTQRVNSVKKC